MNETLPFILINNYIEKQQFQQLIRTTEQNDNYNQWNKDILVEWKSIFDYLLYEKFHMNVKLNKNNLKYITKPYKINKEFISDQPSNIYIVNNCMFCCCLNEFSFNFEKNVNHFIIYKLNLKINNYNDFLTKHGEGAGVGLQILDVIHYINSIDTNNNQTGVGAKLTSTCTSILSTGHILIKTNNKVTNTQLPVPITAKREVKEMPKFKENHFIYFLLYIYAIIVIFMIGVSYTIANKYDLL